MDPRVELLRVFFGAVPGSRCPMCRCEYTPTHPSKEEAIASGDLMSAEQWISGIISKSLFHGSFTQSSEVRYDLMRGTT